MTRQNTKIVGEKAQIMEITFNDTQGDYNCCN